jgi:protein-S-isoprenylcysteine O-methyltransferase Ste14
VAQTADRASGRIRSQELGAVLTHQGILWTAGLAILTPVFAYRMYVEEKLMTREFPDQYPEFQKRTKRVIPFVW